MPATLPRLNLLASALWAVVFAAACSDGSGDACGQAEQQVAECLDRLCAGDEDGAFCMCHEAGQHLPENGSCACAEGTVWDEMRESVCEELDSDPALDCEGFMATVRRFEQWENCE